MTEWRARRWLRRLDRTLGNTPSWRLLQELQQRGDLFPAEVDREGMPLFRVKVADA